MAVAASEKIGLGERIGYGCGDMACNFIYQRETACGEGEGLIIR
jgi:Na+/melibiose symporter-like transporter